MLQLCRAGGGQPGQQRRSWGKEQTGGEGKEAAPNLCQAGKRCLHAGGWRSCAF